MVAPQGTTNPLAPMDMCLAGVFIGKGERIPEDLHEAWRRRLFTLGLEPDRPEAREAPPHS